MHRHSFAQPSDVDVELILAVDASGSVDDAEFALQMGGIAAAFRDPEVRAAIDQGVTGRIAVALEIWAEARLPKDISDWYLIHDEASAERFARVAETFPRRAMGGTGIGRAIIIAVDQFDKNDFIAPRRVIDISGDGRETTTRDWSIVPELARIKADRQGIAINGLAILSDDRELDTYYRRKVITGTDSFVLTASDFTDFAASMRRKLIREISYQPPTSMTPRPPWPHRQAATR